MPCNSNTTCSARYRRAQSFGNQATLLASGTEAFQAIFKAIAEARDSINLEYFILADVVSDGVQLSDLLADKLRAGVKVNMIYDAAGSHDTQGSFFEGMRKAGASVLEFNPLDPFLVRIGWAPNAATIAR
jgi:cardiolipin synthase